MSEKKRRVIGCSKQTVADTAAGPTLPDAATCNYMVGTVETAQLRFTVDGTTPTSTIGHLQTPGQVIVLDQRGEVVNFLAIRTGTTSAEIWWTFYRDLY